MATISAGNLLVRGGSVVDGTGAPMRDADVRVADGVIVEVGPSLSPDGETVVDGAGAIVTPGFIDGHTHFDPTLFWDPDCDPTPQHGVTTVLIGNCSLSLAPLRPEQRGEFGALFAYIEDLPEAVFTSAVPWSWSTYPEYLDALRAAPLAVNVAGLVGHSALRLSVMGNDAWTREAVDFEQVEMAGALDAAMHAGAFGLSTSFFDTDAESRPVPSRWADDDELGALGDVLASHHGVLEFIPDVTSGQFRHDVERIAAVCAPRGVTATWNSLYCDDERPERTLAVLDRAAELQAAGARVYPQVSPRAVDVRVNWSGGMSFFMLPEGWHRAVQAAPVAKAEMLADPGWRATARREWDAVRASFFPHRRPERVRLISVQDPALEPWIGRSLADLVDARGGHPSDVLADWVLENDLDPGVVGVGVMNANTEGVAEMLRHPATVVSNGDAGAHLQMMCAAGDTTLLLTKHVRERGDFTIEAAVHELTARQAEVFGFRDRGTIARGLAGDLVVFALDELAWEAESVVHDLPHGARRLRRPPGGYRATIVGGVVTQADGQLTGARPARVLRGSDARASRGEAA